MNIKIRKTVKTEKVRGLSSKKRRLVLGALLLAFCLSSVGIYALGSEERAFSKAEVLRKKDELQFKADESAARLAEEKIMQDIVDKGNRTKDAIVSKGEYSPITAVTEREPEVTTKHGNKMSEWLGKNVLRIHIPYEIKYVIDMEKISPIVTEEGVFVEFRDEDFEVIVIPKAYTLRTPDKKEKGIFPSEFENEDVLALITANSNLVAEEYSSNQDYIDKAVEETKLMIQVLAESFGSEVTFADKRVNVPLKANISSDEVKGESNNE